jgi:hypothetical protein
MTSTRSFIVSHSVLSKLSDEPVVASHNGREFVFVAGMPMTVQGFYSISAKVIFGAELRLNVAMWEKLHAETRILCQGLDVKLTTGREAFTVRNVMAKALSWTLEGHDRANVLSMVEKVERSLVELQASRSTTSTTT